MDYGFGAVFGCPAHDQRDFDLQKNIIWKLNCGKAENEDDKFEVTKEAYTGTGIIINSKFLNNLKAPNGQLLKR